MASSASHFLHSLLGSGTPSIHQPKGDAPGRASLPKNESQRAHGKLSLTWH
jgi:hypothetical protein